MVGMHTEGRDSFAEKKWGSGGLSCIDNATAVAVS